MSYQIYYPCEPLRPYIENYWTLQTDHELYHQFVVDGQADLLLNYGSAYERGPLYSTGEKLTASNLDGQRQYPLKIQQTGNIDLIGVRFRVGGLAAFTTIPVFQISNLTVDLRAVFGRSEDDLQLALYHQPDERRVELLNRFFMGRLLVRDAHRLTDRIADRVRQMGGTIAIPTLSREFGYSPRTLDRLFGQYYGFSPKFYARIVRFQQALRRIKRGGSLTEIGLDLGYYDLAHFSREFSAFSGQAPDHYRRG
jgi:AraC-like DNA-binding protein